MKFSVVIPVYRTERFLPRCLDSLVAQTGRDFEVVVVDDCSPGEAAGSSSPPYQAGEIAARYDGRFRYIRHETNRGAFQARWTGVKAAKGEYVVPVDPDDYLLPETLAKLREVIERESPDLVSYRIEYDSGKKVWPHWCRHPDATVSGVEALRELTEHKYFTGVASKAFRRVKLLAALRELNAPDEFYANTCDDFLMLVPMLMKCERVAFLDFAGYRYFVNEESTSFSWKTVEGFRKACEQTHQVGNLVLRRARQDDVGSEIRQLAEKAVSGIERWFVQMALEAPASQRDALVEVLRDTLSLENVEVELADRKKSIRRTCVYRFCKEGYLLMRKFLLWRK